VWEEEEAKEECGRRRRLDSNLSEME